MSKETVSTIGEQRRLNYGLQPMGREEFVALVTADLPESPAYFGYDAVMNTKERATLDKTVEAALKPLNVDEVLGLAKAGAQLLDTRDAGDFGRAHFAGSLNIGLGGQYATWAGTLLDRERPIILITEPGSEREAAMRLGRIGFDHVAGYLEGGVEALEHRRELAAGWDRVGPPELAGYLESGVETFVLDVRNPGEFEAKRIGGAVNIPLNKLRVRLAEVPRDRRLVVHCAGGYRSSIAASILQQAGIAEVEELSGGIAAWEAVGLPVVGAPA
jgi:rhodanese-related sulfurtransferase